MDVRIEFPSKGATYLREEYGVYKYDTYPENSVLAGQTRRTFLASYPTLEEAEERHPEAVVVQGSGYQPPYLEHLPDRPDI